MAKSKAREAVRVPMTFEFLCGELRATPFERRELWEFLAFLRFKAMMAVTP